jgi:hypothetical protein
MTLKDAAALFSNTLQCLRTLDHTWQATYTPSEYRAERAWLVQCAADDRAACMAMDPSRDWAPVPA